MSVVKFENKEIVFVGSDSGDWEGLYVNGKLVAEGHILTAQQVLSKIGLSCTSVCAEEGWLEDRGSLPMDFKDVKVGR